MKPILLGFRNGRPVYDMACGAEGVRHDDYIMADTLVGTLREWGELLGVKVTGHPRRRLVPLYRLLSDEPSQREWDNGLPYLNDIPVRRFVLEHPTGASLEELGDFFGLTKERIRQIETMAVDSFRTALRADERACQMRRAG